MKKLSLLLLPLIFVPAIYIYVHKYMEKQQPYSLVDSKVASSEWLDNGLDKNSKTIFNQYGDTMFLKLSDLPDVPAEKGYSLPSIKAYEKQLNYFKQFNKDKYQNAKKAIFDEIFFNLFIDLENRGPSFNIITFTPIPLKQAKVEISIDGNSFKFENTHSDTSFALEQFGIYENQMFVNFSQEMFKAFSKMKIGDLITIKITSSEGKIYNYGYIYNPTSKGGMYIPLMKYNKIHSHLVKPNTEQEGFNPAEWDEFSLNKETHTIFNKYGDTKFVMSTKLDNIFIPTETLDSRYNALKKGDKTYWVARESFPIISTYMNELQLKSGEEIKNINKSLISKFFIDITLNEPVGDKVENTMNLVTFSKEEYPKITRIYLIIGETKIVLDNFYINTPKFLGEKSNLYMNDIKVPFTDELFKVLIKLKYQNKITLKLVSKDETYEYTYLYEPNEKGGLHIPLMKYEALHRQHPKREIKEVVATPQESVNPLLQTDEPLPVPQSNTTKLHISEDEGIKKVNTSENKKEIKKDRENTKKAVEKEEKIEDTNRDNGTENLDDDEVIFQEESTQPTETNSSPSNSSNTPTPKESVPKEDTQNTSTQKETTKKEPVQSTPKGATHNTPTPVETTHTDTEKTVNSEENL